MKYNIIRETIVIVISVTINLFFPVDNVISTAFAGDVVFIANKSVSENSLTKDEIKNIFLGRKTIWNDNQKIVFVTMEDSEVHETFLKEFIGKTIFQYTNYWRKQVFTGKGKPPKSFGTENELIDYVANTEGALAYISFKPDENVVKIISVP